MIVLIAVIVLSMGSAFGIQTSPPVSRAFHGEVTKSLRVDADEGEVVYSGYMQSRKKIMEVYNARGGLRYLSPLEFQAKVEEVDSALSEFLDQDQRHAIAFLQAADWNYFNLMVQLSDTKDESAAQKFHQLQTAWRLDWMFNSPMLPDNRVPGFINVLSYGTRGTMIYPLDATEMEYWNLVAPILEKLESAIVFERYDLHELNESVSAAFRAQNVEVLEQAISRFVSRGFVAHDLINELRAINLKFWRKIEQRLDSSQRARFSAWFSQATFPYLPELAEMYHAADEAMLSAANAVERDGIAVLVEGLHASVVLTLGPV